MEPTISLCIPTYNRASLLNAALRQISGQWAEEFEDHIEIIVSDNSSTDDTLGVLQKFAAQFPRIFLRIHLSSENKGPDANIYQTVQMAHGVFVYILSDDDLLLPGALMKLLDLINDFPELDAFSLNIRSFRESPVEITPCWAPLPKDTIVQDCNKALVLLNPLFLSVFAFRRSLISANDYSRAIGTNLLQSYLFLDVMAHGNGILVTAEPYLAQRQENTSGWNFFRVMTTNLRDWLTRAEEIGFSPSASSTFLAHHLRSQIVSAIISFKLYGRTSKLGPGASTHPEANTYRDGMRRLWQVYGPEPFLLIVVFPLILVPGGLMRQVRNLYHLLRPRKAIPLAVHAK